MSARRENCPSGAPQKLQPLLLAARHLPALEDPYMLLLRLTAIFVSGVTFCRPTADFRAVDVVSGKEAN